MTHPFLDVARSLAIEAAARLMDLRLKPLVKERKADHSLVTNADHEADRILRHGLRAAFPDHAILTEESGLDGPADAEYLWLIDPLDGTKAYAVGVTGFSVMVGLLKEGKPYMGVVLDPLEGDLYEAVRGEGTYYEPLTPTLSPSGERGTKNDSPRPPTGGEGVRVRGAQAVRVYVSPRKAWSQMPVITSTGFPERLEKSLRPHFPGPWIPPVNSVGVKVGYMVRQEVDIYINHHAVHYWDTCAPQIILEEAGGIITYSDGTPLIYALDRGNYRHDRPTVATNRTRHPEVLSVLKSLKRPGTVE